jgi:hypothetical protein
VKPDGSVNPDEEGLKARSIAALEPKCTLSLLPCSNGI